MPAPNMALTMPCAVGTISGGNSSLMREKARGNMAMPRP